MSQFIKIGTKWYNKTQFHVTNSKTNDTVNRFIKTNSNWNPIYSYSFVTTSDWSSCTANCDGGTQDLIKQCKRSDGVYKHNNYCINSGVAIPSVASSTATNNGTSVRYRRSCNTHPCLNKLSFTVQHDCGVNIRPIQVNATGSSTAVGSNGSISRSSYGLKDYTYIGNTCSYCSWNGNPQKVQVLLSEYIREGAPAPYGFFIDFKSRCKGSNYVKIVDVTSNLRVFSLTSLVGGAIPPASNTSAWTEAYPYCWGGPSCRVIKYGWMHGDTGDGGSLTMYVTPK